MARLPPPILLAVIPCETYHQDRLTGRFTLTHITKQIGSSGGLPINFGPIGVYVAVTGVRGRVPFSLRVVTPDGTEIPSRVEWEEDSNDPLHVYERGFQFAIEFRAFGVYSFRAYAGEDMLGEWRLLVAEVKR